MKAIGYQQPLPIDHAEALQDIALPPPVAKGRELLVSVRAVSVNPVDTKIRSSSAPAAGEWKVLGWDAAGIVRAVGPEVSLFKPGDHVWYAGSIARPGTNSELHVVDERIVGHMPASLGFGQAAALPLTAITAWEMLFDRLEVEAGRSILIIGAAGGVGSIMVQLTRQLTNLVIVGTASRPESREWVSAMGAQHVIDHTKPLAEQLKAIGIPQVDYVVSLTHTEQYFSQIVDVLLPQGKFGLIDDPAAPLDVSKLKRKCLSLHWELMFTRSLFETPDMIRQHELLDEVAKLIDAGTIKTTLSQTLAGINAANLRKAHALIESGQARGKIVLEGF